jgi:hypothetical protein
MDRGSVLFSPQHEVTDKQTDKITAILPVACVTSERERERDITVKGTARSSGQHAAYPLEKAQKDFTVANLLLLLRKQVLWVLALRGLANFF